MLVWLVLCLGLASSFAAPSDCPVCDRNLCSVPTNCVAGEVFDHCTCCHVCGLVEGEQCSIPGVDSACGYNMTCQALPASSDSKCVCDYSDELCGTDGNTYRNICHMKEVQKSEGIKGLNVLKKGPCPRKPILVTGPQHAVNRSGGKVALSCEADGYPIPTIEWLYTRSDGKVKYLPGDSGDISVNLRGGPEKNQITGWIQIQNLVKDHEGYYTCMALNREGKTERAARVLVRG